MSNPLVLTFDLGTQSMKALLIDKNGETVLSSQVKYDYPCIPSDERGKAEQEPDFYYDRLCEAGALLKPPSIHGRAGGLAASRQAAERPDPPVAPAPAQTQTPP